MTDPRGSRSKEDDRGAVLVLALIFLFAVGMTIGAIVTLVSANLVVTQGLQRQRSSQYGAAAALQGAIAAIRYTGQGSPPTCPTYPPTSSITINSNSYVVYCSEGVPNGFYGRIVQFDACLSANTTLASCEQHAIIEADVVYNDVAPGCTSGGGACTAYGTTATVTTWDVKTADG